MTKLDNSVIMAIFIISILIIILYLNRKNLLQGEWVDDNGNIYRFMPSDNTFFTTTYSLDNYVFVMNIFTNNIRYTDQNTSVTYSSKDKTITLGNGITFRKFKDSVDNSPFSFESYIIEDSIEGNWHTSQLIGNDNINKMINITKHKDDLTKIIVTENKKSSNGTWSDSTRTGSYKDSLSNEYDIEKISKTTIVLKHKDAEFTFRKIF